MSCNKECDKCTMEICVDCEDILKSQEEYDRQIARNDELSTRLTRQRRWELANYERARENKRKWYEKNKAYYDSLHRKQVESGYNKEKCRQYYLKHKEEIREKQREYYKSKRLVAEGI